MNFNFSKEFIIQYFVTNLFILAVCCACYLIYDFCALVAEPKRLEKEMAARKRAKEMQILESMPSAADVRPVVLCRDCKHYNTVYELKCQHIFGLTEPDEDDFCSLGEWCEGCADNGN